jgi:hypothetical protein
MRKLNLLILLASDCDSQLLMAEIIGQIDPSWTVWTAAAGWEVMKILQKTPGGVSPLFLIIDQQLRDMSANHFLSYLSEDVQHDKIYKFVLTEKNETQNMPYFLTHNVWLFRKPVRPSEFKFILTEILSIVTGVSREGRARSNARSVTSVARPAAREENKKYPWI